MEITQNLRIGEVITSVVTIAEYVQSEVKISGETNNG